MPTFVITAIGQPTQKATVDSSPVSVGRDPQSDIVLPDNTVSRQHAVFMQDEKGRWFASCVSDTNPIVVGGMLTTSSVAVTEGSEILIGSKYLLIFSENELSARKYMGETSYMESECPKCKWRGMIGTFRRSPSCPRCGVGQPAQVSLYQHDQAAKKATDKATSAMTREEVQRQFAQLRAAKRSYVERIDGKGKDGERRELEEGKALLISKAPGSGFELFGLTLGDGVQITWDGSRHVATSSMKIPGLKVNGQDAKTAALKHGDVLEVGSNRFRFSTG